MLAPSFTRRGMTDVFASEPRRAQRGVVSREGIEPSTRRLRVACSLPKSERIERFRRACVHAAVSRCKSTQPRRNQWRGDDLRECQIATAGSVIYQFGVGRSTRPTKTSTGARADSKRSQSCSRSAVSSAGPFGTPGAPGRRRVPFETG